MALTLAKLPDRYLDYLEQFTLFLILTIDGIRLLVDSKVSKTASRKVTKRLHYAGWLEELLLPRGGPGYMLTPRALHALGLPKRKRKGVSHDLLIQHIGLLYACLHADIDKHSVSGLMASHPQLFCRGLPAGNFGIDAENRLVWIHVSHGGLAHNLATKVEQIIRKRKSFRAFRDLIRRREFGVVVAVPSTEVAIELNSALMALDIDPRVHVSPVVVPELAPLLLTRSRHAS